MAGYCSPSVSLLFGHVIKLIDSHPVANVHRRHQRGKLIRSPECQADSQNFAVAEEEKRKEQIEAFIRKSEPASAHVSWIDRLNPYRLMKAHHHSIKVETLPPNLVLPLKQNVGLDVGTGTTVC